MAKPIGKTFVEIGIDAEKYNKGVVDVKTTTKKKLTEIEKAWKGMGKKSEATIDQMKAKINKDYDTIKKHSLSTADDILRAEKAKNEKIARINKKQFGEQKSLLDMAKKHWMALSAAAVAAVYAIGRILKESLSSFADWETALVDMGKVTSESLESITDRIRELPPELGMATELVRGYYQVISAGVTEPKKAIDLLTEASKLAKSAHMEVDEVIKGLTKVMAGYEGEIETTTDAADLLYAIEKEGQTAVRELIPVIGGLAKISKDMGVAADEMGAALATVTLTAGTTSEAATRYEAVLIALMKPTTAMKAAIKDMGYESAQLAIKDIGLTEVLKKLKEMTGGSADKMAELFGRKEALVGMSALASRNFETLTGKIDAMAEKTGMADKAWQNYMTTLNAIWDTFKNTVGNMLIKIGVELAPAIKDIVKKTGEWLGENEKFITQQISTYYDAAATSINAIATALKAIGTAWDAAMGYFMGGDTPIKKHKENIALAEKMIKLLRSQRNHAEVMFKAATFGNQVWADAIERINGLIREQRAIIDTNKKSLESWNKEAGEKGPENQIKKNKDAIDKTTDAIKKTTDAVDDTASALDDLIFDWDDYTRHVVNSANEAYAAWKDASEDTAVEVASALDESSFDWDDYERHVVDVANEAYIAWKKSLEDTADKAGKVAIKMIGSFADVIDSVASTAKSVASKVSSFISEIWSGLKSAIGMVGGVITFFITFPGDLKNALEGFAESIEDLPGIVEEFFDAADIFFQNLPRIITTFIDSVGVFIDGLVAALPGVVDALIAELPRLVDAFIEGLPKIIDALIAGAEKFTLAFVEQVPRLVEAIMAEIPDMVTSFMTVFLPAILDMIPKVLEKILQGLPDIIKAFSAGMPMVVTALIDAIVDLIPILAEEMPLIVESLTDAMIEDSPRIIDAIIKGIPRIVEALVKAIGKRIIGGPGGGGYDIGDVLDPGGIFHHAGGIIGQEGQASRSASASVFAGASRAHRGLIAGEVPIIAKRGEGIFTPKQMAALGGRGVTINSPLIHIGGNLIADKQTFDDFAEQIDYAITKRNKRVYA